MPYADPEEKRNYMRQWRVVSTNRGYGKWLYARRKLRFDDAERFRKVLEEIVANDPDRTSYECQLAHRALLESREAEEALGDFTGARKFKYRNRELADGGGT